MRVWSGLLKLSSHALWSVRTSEFGTIRRHTLELIWARKELPMHRECTFFVAVLVVVVYGHFLTEIRTFMDEVYGCKMGFNGFF